MPLNLTLSSLSYVVPYRPTRGSANIIHIQESTCASTAIVKIGDVVSQDTNTASNSFRMVKMAAHIPSTAIFGIAGGNSTSDGSTTGLADTNGYPTTNRRLPVWVAERNTEFVAYSNLSSVTHASTLVGTYRVLSRDSTLDIWKVDAANSTAGDVRVRITEVLDPFSANGRVVFRFVSTALVYAD